jgi:hypothetical protein
MPLFLLLLMPTVTISMLCLEGGDRKFAALKFPNKLAAIVLTKDKQILFLVSFLQTPYT